MPFSGILLRVTRWKSTNILIQLLDSFKHAKSRQVWSVDLSLWWFKQDKILETSNILQGHLLRQFLWKNKRQDKLKMAILPSQWRLFPNTPPPNGSLCVVILNTASSLKNWGHFISIQAETTNPFHSAGTYSGGVTSYLRKNGQLSPGQSPGHTRSGRTHPHWHSTRWCRCLGTACTRWCPQRCQGRWQGHSQVLSCTAPGSLLAKSKKFTSASNGFPRIQYSAA